MPRMSDSSQRAMMRAARNIVAPAMRRVARIRTKQTAAAVNIHNGPNGVEVRAGTPTGPWGWTPIQASMFDNNRRHPLFGDKRKWYHQGDFPITAMTLKLVSKLVEDEYVQEDLRIILGERGFTDI
jgi:hypothetical protein